VITPALTATEKPLLQIEGLTKNFAGQFALNSVSFNLHRGEILGLIGPNGAGKTTLLETLAGILPADDGRITSEGKDIPQHRRRQTLFYVPDGVRPYGEQYVLQVLSFIAGVFRRSPKDVEQTVAAAGLREVLGKRVNSLSKGFSRRLLLALGFLAPQPVLLMDEPFDGFDLRQARDMMPVLRGMASGGRTLLLSIHQMADAERVCDGFVLLADGTVRGTGTLEELRSRTALPNGSLEDIFLALT
jgi:ABC-2 type transport system ATP-binding protein